MSADPVTLGKPWAAPCAFGLPTHVLLPVKLLTLWAIGNGYVVVGALVVFAAMGFPGYAIGGVSVGEPKDEMLGIMAHTPHKLHAHKQRYLMDVGTPEDLVQKVADGVDMFDCVMPTRNARNGTLFTRYGDLKIRNARHKTVSKRQSHVDRRQRSWPMFRS